ncbi:MAG: FecR family protein [Rhodospirillales bacterium]
MPRRLRIAALALVLGAGAAGQPGAAEQAGVAAAVRGEVQIAERSGAVGKQARSGEPVFLGNAVTSGPNSGMQIILLDETTFTIGPNSQIVIDEFIYDPKTSAGKMAASVTRGVFRFVTGKMSREQPGAMQVKMPTGTIGIRGTAGLGQADNGVQRAILLGPGNDTDTNNRGGLDLSAGDTLISLIRAGWGSTLANGTWGPAERFDPVLIAQLLAQLRAAWSAPPGAGQQTPSGDANQNAGNSLFDSQDATRFIGGLSASVLYAQLIQNEADLRGRSSLAAQINGPTSYDMLRSINTGTFQWKQSGVPLGPLTNTYMIELSINFATRTVGGGQFSGLTISDGTIDGSFIALPGVSYNTLVGNATYSFLDTATLDTPTCGGNCRIRLLASILNRNGVIGNDLAHSVTVRNAADTVLLGSGSGTATGRRPVP